MHHLRKTPPDHRKPLRDLRTPHKEGPGDWETHRTACQRAKADVIALLKREIADRQIEIAKLRYALALLDQAPIRPSRKPARSRKEPR